MERIAVAALSQPRAVALRLVQLPRSLRAAERELRFEARAIAALTALSLAGTLLAPALHDRPLLLMALSPRLLFVALAAGHTPLGLFLAVGLVRLTVADPIHFSIGRALGSRARLPFRARLERSRPLALAAVLVRPSGPILAVAGSLGLRGRTVALLDVASTAVYLLTVHAGASRVL